MNMKISGSLLAIGCAGILIAHAQTSHSHTRRPTPARSNKESVRTAVPEIKGKAIDLRRKPKRRPTPTPSAAPIIPVIAPLYPLPQGSSGTAITASNGYVFVVIGSRLFKVDQKSLKVVNIANLVVPETSTSSSGSAGRRTKIVAEEQLHSAKRKKKAD